MADNNQRFAVLSDELTMLSVEYYFNHEYNMDAYYHITEKYEKLNFLFYLPLYLWICIHWQDMEDKYFNYFSL